jgi:hypothetical protein
MDCIWDSITKIEMKALNVKSGVKYIPDIMATFSTGATYIGTHHGITGIDDFV